MKGPKKKTCAILWESILGSHFINNSSTSQGKCQTWGLNVGWDYPVQHALLISKIILSTCEDIYKFSPETSALWNQTLSLPHLVFYITIYRWPIYVTFGRDCPQNIRILFPFGHKMFYDFAHFFLMISIIFFICGVVWGGKWFLKKKWVRFLWCQTQTSKTFENLPQLPMLSLHRD